MVGVLELVRDLLISAALAWVGVSVDPAPKDCERPSSAIARADCPDKKG